MPDITNNGEVKKEEWLVYQNELEVVFSLMEDRELMRIHEMLEKMIEEKVYIEKEFPLSCGEMRSIQHSIMFSFWIKKKKGIRIECGEVVVCELEESPYWKRYQPNSHLMETIEEDELNNPDKERDVEEKEEGEFV